MKVINLFGGPGSGKSTTAAGLFYLMKVKNYKVELVTEYAKDMVWEKRDNIFRDQLYISAKQNRKLIRLLEHEIEWVITDSPLLLGVIYQEDTFAEKVFNLNNVIWDIFSDYDNINYYLYRTKKYISVGRNQNEMEARNIDNRIKQLLTDIVGEFKTIKGDAYAPFNILEDIEKHYA